MIVEQRIATFLVDRGIMQSRVADYIGMERATLNRILKGKGSLSAEQYGKACEFLHVDPNYFLIDREEENK